MLMRISRDLKWQEIWAEGNELVTILGRDRDKKGRRIHERSIAEKEFVARFKHPHLLTDVIQMVKLTPAKRDTVFALYGSYPRTVEYDGVSVWWDPALHKDVWGPSIDTLVFANAMREAKNILTDRVHSAVEIACGSGFLGKFIMHKCRNLRELHLVDINKYAINCAMDNIRSLNSNQIITYSVGDGRKLGGKKFDLVICNPPYVPRPGSINGNPYEGVELLYDIIVDGKEYLNDGGVVVTNASSLCKKISDRAIEEARMYGELKSAKIIRRKHVPFKVMPILNNKEWMRYLKKRGLRKNLKQGYEYWHNINIIKLAYS